MKFRFLTLNVRRALIAAFYFGAVAIGTNAQVNDKPTFQKLTFDGNGLSIVLPEDAVVNVDSKRQAVFIWATIGNVRVNAQLHKTKLARNWLKTNVEVMQKRGTPYRISNVKDYYYGVSVKQDGKILVVIEAASLDKYLMVSVEAKDTKDPNLAPFLASILIYGKPIVSEVSASPLSFSFTKRVEDLESSQDVISALNHKQTGMRRVIFDENATPDRVEGVEYSRGVILLSVPRAKFGPAIEKESADPATVLVELKADGNVGDITVVKRFKNEANTNDVIEAAKNIKFLPAQINGKNVDIIRSFQYSHSVSYAPWR